MWSCCRNDADSASETGVKKAGQSGFRGSNQPSTMVQAQKEYNSAYGGNGNPANVNYSFTQSNMNSGQMITTSLQMNSSNPQFAQKDVAPAAGSGVQRVERMTPLSEDAKRTLASMPPFDKSKGPVSYSQVIQGPYLYPDGATYKGEFNGGRREGYGVQVWPDGSQYEGFWQHDKHHYFGRLIHSDGDCFEGEWRENMAHGKGRYRRPNGVEYNGDWLADLQHGIGVEIDPTSGTRYEGSFLHGKKQGQGVATFSNGHRYTGEFQDNMMHGKGEYTWSDGRVYVGAFSRNKMEGEGRFKWPTGMEYFGAFVNDRKEGFGTLSWPDGSKYVGNFLDGKQEGDGTLFDSRGAKTVGVWRKGELISTKPGY